MEQALWGGGGENYDILEWLLVYYKIFILTNLIVTTSTIIGLCGNLRSGGEWSSIPFLLLPPNTIIGRSACVCMHVCVYVWRGEVM